MADQQKTVFISYRRANEYVARAVYQALLARGFDVFVDVTSIEAGDFEKVIFQQIAARSHFLVILTPSALERTVEPGDWLRREIEYAIETKRNIVPLLFEDFTFTSLQQYLTGKLASLARYNALNVPDAYFDQAMEKLASRFLQIAVEPYANQEISQLETPLQPPIDTSIVATTVATLDQSNNEEQSISYLLEGVYFSLELNDFERALQSFRKALVLNDNFINEIEKLKQQSTIKKHLFLSYSHQNEKELLRVKQTLQDEGFSTWTDENLKPGTPIWEKEIQKAIEFAWGFIVLLSPTSKESTWVTREIGYARAQRVDIYPLLIDGDEATAIPLALIGSQWVDISIKYVSGMAKLIKELGDRKPNI